MLGEDLGHDLNDRYRSTEGYSRPMSHENGNTHEAHTWWCYSHGRSEGECLTTGRQSHGRDEGDRCGYSEMLEHRERAKERANASR